MNIIKEVFQYLFLALAICISIFTSITCIVIFLFPLIQINILFTLLIILFFIPTFIIVLIFILTKIYTGKNSKILKIFSYFIILSILFIQPYLYAIPIFLSTNYAEKNSEPYNPIRPLSEYNYLVKNKDKYTEHFPDKIPDNATNIELFEDANPFGSVEQYLKFNADDKYINKELEKYNFKIIATGKDYKGIHIRNDLRKDDDIYYVLGDSQLRSAGVFPYSYGIIVNRKTNKIIYYFSKYD